MNFFRYRCVADNDNSILTLSFTDVETWYPNVTDAKNRYRSVTDSEGRYLEGYR